MFGHSRNQEVAKRANREQQVLDVLRSLPLLLGQARSMAAGCSAPACICSAPPDKLRSLTASPDPGGGLREGCGVRPGCGVGSSSWLAPRQREFRSQKSGCVTVYLLHWMALCCPVRTGSRLVTLTSGAVVGRSTSASHPAETEQAVETRLARSGSGAAAWGRLWAPLRTMGGSTDAWPSAQDTLPCVCQLLHDWYYHGLE